MATQHRIDVFTEGCSSCEGAVAYGQELASSSADYEVHVWDVTQEDGATRMREVGVAEVPALAVDGEPLACCAHGEGGTGA
jgi:hypothetical protein